jgi:hypothetical protein
MVFLGTATHLDPYLDHHQAVFLNKLLNVFQLVLNIKIIMIFVILAKIFLYKYIFVPPLRC